jgi:hypothetical protein
MQKLIYAKLYQTWILTRYKRPRSCYLCTKTFLAGYKTKQKKVYILKLLSVRAITFKH